MTLYIITTCTSKKKFPSSISLNKTIKNNLEDTVNHWKTEINKINKKYIAEDLYAGVQWSNILKAKKILSKKFDTKLLIMSAGLGLIDSRKRIPSYSSTFAKGNIDSVNSINKQTSKSEQFWWNKINQFDLNTLEKDAYIFLVLSKNYIEASKTTVEKIIEIYKERVFIISSSNDANIKNLYKENLLPFNSKFNQINKGTFISINQRAFSWLSSEIISSDLEINKSTLDKRISQHLADIQIHDKFEKIKLTDNELLEYIKNQILNLTISSATKGIKELRKDGYACEQKRYQNHFKIIKEEMS